MSTEPGSLFWLHALTPLRVGGDAGLGAINLPTMREQHTGHPFVPGSVIKGILRGALTPPAPLDADPPAEAPPGATRRRRPARPARTEPHLEPVWPRA
jgi:hypothetical protein